MSADVGVAKDRYPDKTSALYPFLIESLTEFAVFAVASDGSIMSWNSGAQHTFGYREAEIIGKNFSIIFTPDDIAADAPATELAIALDSVNADFDRWHVRKDGSRFWGTNTVQPIYNSAGDLLGFAKLVRDITERYLALQALSESEERQRLLIESVHEYAIFSVALDGSITTWNIGAQSTFGYLDREIVGRPLSVLFTADDVLAGAPATQLREATARGQCAEERWLVRKDATRFLASCRLSQLKRGPDGQQRGFVNIAHDITEARRIADDMRRRALNDQLTELPNRAAFHEHVNRAIASMKRRSTDIFAVLFIDLDHFKVVNDTYGHIVADKLLAFTARRLEGCIRSEDIIARLGGDEFAILLNSITGLSDATDAGDRISAEMSRPVTVDGNDVSVTASVGIALGDTRYEGPEDILRDADTAMYRAKTNGRARSVVFEREICVSDSRRSSRTLEIDLEDALERDELRVEYQPILELASGSIAGFEALVRWQHPLRGLLQPADFVPKAEERNAIIPIDRWVFRTACNQLSAWRSEGIAASCTMNVNFSSRQFSQPDLWSTLRDTLAHSGLNAGCVRLEITESALLERSDVTLELMKQIRALGVDIHIDDFGIGYSSLSALGHMPVSALKIDRSFLTNMDTHSGCELVRAIVTLAHNLGLVVIAEGVETAEQLSRLSRFNCDFGQGFLFSKPLDAAAARNFLGAAGFGAA